ncbi:YesL family protein [Virgibacillus sp. DJP39]|uniref:YesL family protein n=1 Tax=Virgibacillus sp. DJP39 TaxID=3409790 RepID=UPI003BB4A1ED
MKGIMGGLYGVSEWISRFAVVNLLWLLLNLPLVLIVVNIMWGKQEGAAFLMVPLISLMPLLFFPATSAMFASARDWVLSKDSSSITKAYFRYYKENYKKSLLGGMLLTGLWLIWGIDYYYFKDESVLFMFSFLMMGVVLFVYTINFFSIIVHYELKLRSMLKKSLIITIGSPILFLTVAIASGVILYVSVNGPLFLIPFFTGSLISFVSFSAFYRLYIKLTTVHD